MPWQIILRNPYIVVVEDKMGQRFYSLFSLNGKNYLTLGYAFYGMVLQE
jgi:hypothetical protein